MKVLQLAKFYPPEWGGIESVVHELTEGLNRLGWPTDVLCAHRTWRGVEEQVNGYRVMRAGSLGMLLSTSMSPALLARTRRIAGQYDLIHVHMPNPMAALALWWARPTAKVIVHWHSDVIHQRAALQLYEPLQHWLLRRADAVIATSPPYANSSRALSPWGDKISVIPLGIGDNHARSDPDRVAALRAAYPSKRIIFALGRMAPYKGFDVLIEAAAHLPDDVVVLVGGAGAMLPQHRAHVAARGLETRVHFLGPIPENELTTYHFAADVFWMPSVNRAEAFGVAALEAMAAGRPVVCSAIEGSGLPWLNTHGVTGLTVRPGNAEALAAALQQLLTDTAAAARMGRQARERFFSRFTAAAMVGDVASLYRRLVAA